MNVVVMRGTTSHSFKIAIIVEGFSFEDSVVDLQIIKSHNDNKPDNYTKATKSRSIHTVCDCKQGV